METLIGEEVENLPKTTNLPGYRCYNEVRAHHMFSRILKLQINEKKNQEIVFCFCLKVAFHFFHLQILKKIFQKAILSLKFKFPANDSKQQIQISSSR